MSSITIDTVQGVGDLFWNYQKLSPYYDKINWIVEIVDINCPAQKRSLDWLPLFPKTGDIITKLVTSDDYNAMFQQDYPLKDVMKAAKKGPVKYACNWPLEFGVRIEDIDPDMKVAWDIPVTIHECPLPYKKYVSLYVSGNTGKVPSTWNEYVWARFVKEIYNKFGLTLPVILFGASYDAQVIGQVATHLRNMGITNHYYIDSYPANVLYIIKNAELFIGYQSGLSILADNIGTPQIMLYFPGLNKLRHAWPNLDHINSGVYQSFLFTDNFKEIISRVQLINKNCISGNTDHLLYHI